MPGKVSKATPEAFLLTGIGGGIDAIGILSLSGLFVSHMSGNSAALGAAFGQGQWLEGVSHLFAVPIFVLGLFLGYVAMVSEPSFRRCAWVLLVEAILLSTFAAMLFLGGDPNDGTGKFFLFATPALLAMGLQNSTLRLIGRAATPSTYVTGVLDTLSKSLAQGCLSAWYVRTGRSVPERMQGENFADARRAAGLWCCYVGGALLGSGGLLFAGRPIVILPIIVLVGVTARFFSLGPTKGPPQSGPAA